MCQWLTHLFGRRKNSSLLLSDNRNQPDISGFWFRVHDQSLSQGEYLPDCLVPIVPANYHVGAATGAKVQIATANLIVLTQACDLANEKVTFAALCPIHSLDELAARDAKYKKRDIRNEIRRGRIEGLHMLGSPSSPEDNSAALVADFHQIFSLPVSYLRSHAEQLGGRWRLASPYLEHFSQSFARFFMRVGLPSSIEKF